MTDNFELYSFDIFDTLITRKVATPTGIFALMKEIINKDLKFKDIPNDVKENFYLYRTNSEYYLRCINRINKNGLDITLDEIYNHIQETYFLDENQTGKLKNLEVETEKKNLIAIEENVQKLKKLINNNKRVILISDMYLSYDVIKEILINIDPCFKEIPLYLSSETGYMKSNKELYKYVKEKENVEYKNWLHFGDNKKADYNNAKSLGIKAELYGYISFLPYEKTLLNANIDNPYVQLVIGCAKNLRLQKFKNSKKAGLGVSLAGAIFYPYVSWLIKQAYERKIKRLYFIARDGYVLKLMSDKLIKDRNLDIETNYIYGSRKAWRLPALTLDNFELRNQFIKTVLWTANKLDNVFDIDHNELVKILPKQFRNYKKKIQSDKLKDYLMSDGKIINAIVKGNILKRINIVNYLKQTVNINDNNFAFVDLDGSGNTFNCLSELISDFYMEPITSFYMASTPAVFTPLNSKRHYFYNIREPLLGSTLELLSRAPHGQTLGYRQNKDGKTEPVLEDFNVNALNEWGYEEYIKGLIEFTSAFNQYEKEFDYICFENQFVMMKYINYIFKSIDKDTADMLGSIIHGFYGAEKTEFAPKLNLFDAIKYLFTKKVKTENITFSKARSSKTVKDIINYKDKHKNLRKEIINVYVSRRKRKASLTLLGLNVNFSHLIFK